MSTNGHFSTPMHREGRCNCGSAPGASELAADLEANARLQIVSLAKLHPAHVGRDSEARYRRQPSCHTCRLIAGAKGA